MTDESRSHFQLTHGDVEIEITGSWSFVQRMYRAVMRDLDRAESKSTPQTDNASTNDSSHVVWIIRCGEMMRRIYMAEADDLSGSPVAEALDPEAIGTLYIEKDAFGELLADVADGEETLWARLTEAGREVLAEPGLQ